MVERAVDALLCFLDAEGELGVSEIARRLGIDKGRVHRFLKAFKHKGLVAINARTHRYVLGFRVLELSNSLVRQFDVVAQVLPFLRDLRDDSSETAGLSVQVGDHRVHLVQVESEHEICQRLPVGKPLPIHAGAVGKLFLAFMPSQELESILATSLWPLTEHTITDPNILRQELDRVRQQGYAMSAGERAPGSRSIAAPAWSWRGDVMALNITGPAYRFTQENAIRAAGLLLEVAARFTRQLGGESYATFYGREGSPDGKAGSAIKASTQGRKRWH